MEVVVQEKVCPCLCRSGIAQAGRTLSERLAHACLIRIYVISGIRQREEVRGACDPENRSDL